ncbi:hypothetical protein [Pleomorphomonas sp. PLEO]|uniref:hypothetical protein n=1 Tax=Pleomorphomonas sp. PLEO TaxID=3239306 RepID=UPI00351F3AA3
MSNKINDGGMAFPDPKRVLVGSPVTHDSGMSCRAWFAGNALPAVISHYGPADSAVDEAYRLADKMIARMDAPRPPLDLDTMALELASVINEIPPVTAYLGGSAQRVSLIQTKIKKVLEEVARDG